MIPVRNHTTQVSALSLFRSTLLRNSSSTVHLQHRNTSKFEAERKSSTPHRNCPAPHLCSGTVAPQFTCSTETPPNSKRNGRAPRRTGTALHHIENVSWHDGAWAALNTLYSRDLTSAESRMFSASIFAIRSSSCASLTSKADTTSTRVIVRTSSGDDSCIVWAPSKSRRPES